jgi:hypothetical protein
VITDSLSLFFSLKYSLFCVIEFFSHMELIHWILLICHLFYFMFFFIVVLSGNTLWHLQTFLLCIKYIILECTWFTSLVFHPSSTDF